MDELLHVMARLRDPERGCTWDRAQDFRSLIPYLLEESYEVADLLEQAAAHLGAIAAYAAPGPLEQERVAFELHDAWLRFDLARVRLYSAAANGAGGVSERYREAKAALQRVYDWGETYLEDPRYLANFQFIHALFWQLRLDKIHAEHAPGGPLGWLRRGPAALQVGLLLRRLTGIFEEPAAPDA